MNADDGPTSGPRIQPIKPDGAFGEEITDDLAADAGEGLQLTRRVEHGTDDINEEEGIALEDISGEHAVPD